MNYVQADYYLKLGDELQPWARTLLGGDLAPVDLTNATSVTFRMRKQGAAAMSFDDAAAFVSPRTSGQVIFDWSLYAAKLAALTAGVYYAEWVVTFTGAKDLTFPNDGHLVVVVTARL